MQRTEAMGVGLAFATFGVVMLWFMVLVQREGGYVVPASAATACWLLAIVWYGRRPRG